MDNYPYATLGADGWFRCDRLHNPDFPTLLQNVLHCFGYMRTPRVPWPPVPSVRAWALKVLVDILTHPTDLTMSAWFTTARGDDLDDTL
jgi:hypothetical protein